MKLHTGHREVVRRHPRRECLRRTAPWKVWPARCRKPPQVGKNRRSKIPTVKCRNPTGCKRPAKVPTKPEGPESRTARYQIGDIRSYLFNNITFYGAFLQSPTAAFPPAVHSLPEGRAAFPHAKRGGNGQPAHIPPSGQKTLFLHVDKEKQKSFGKASLFRPCRLTSFGEPHIFAL